MPFDPRRVKALFNAALDLPDPTDRPAFVDRECGDDRELRRRLDDLLAAYDQPADALERPLVKDAGRTTAPEGGPIPAAPSALAADLTAADSDQTDSHRPEIPAPAAKIGSIIAGRYKLREEIGEGGMGSVYLAEQLQPVKRRVALKLIKVGMDSKIVLARFESERQALALMDHPNIAKVLDAGTTEAGRPFFVMELVKGIPLTEYCDQHRLGLLERLALFRQICSAVQHAHQKGIIHRDLKPSNILVESHDGTPVPRVIDFGLAKAISGLQLTEQSLYSAFGTVAGTPLYMAPEQATFNAIDIDTRADIYALGVILYETLTGSTPIRRETFRQAAIDEMMRLIREVEPPTPSSRISTSENLPNLAATRQTEPSRLGRFVRGDLDWIVMKALAKERHRRYESPIAFSHDIERFLNHEPVSAGPPTAAYRFRKFVRRNRPRVIAASLVFLVLVGGIIGTTLGLFEARRQTAEKEKARNAEATQREYAEKRLAQIEKANEILGSIFTDLNPKKEEKDGPPLLTRLGERLDQATEQIEGDAIGDPLTVARMQNTLGLSQLGLGFPEKAIRLFIKARATFTARLGAEHPDTLESMNDLALGYEDAGQFDRSLPLKGETLSLYKSSRGPDHPDTLVSMGNLATGYFKAGRLDLALPLWEETLALEKSKLGPDHPSTLSTMGNLATGYDNAGKVDRALRLLEETLALKKAKLGRDHKETVTIMNNLAICYQHAGRLDRAVPLLEETLALRKSKLGLDHPDTLGTMSNLAVAYYAAGKLDRVLPILEETLTLRKSKSGPDHPDTLVSMNNLAFGYKQVGKVDRAVPLFEETFALQKSRLGPDHPSTLTTMGNLADAYLVAGKLDRALPLFEETLALQKSKLGSDHPSTLITMNGLASGYRDAGKLDQALPLFEETLALRKSKLGPNHPDTLQSMNALASGYWSAKRLDKSVPLFEECVKLERVKLGDDHPKTKLAKANLGVNYNDVGRVAEALPLLEEAKLAAGKDPQLGFVRGPLVDAYTKAGRHDLAIALAEETYALQSAKLGPDHLDTLVSKSNLAACYATAGNLDRGLSLMEETLALMKSKLGPDHPKALTLMSNLGRTYEAAGKLDRALPLMEETLAIQKSKLGPDHPSTLISLNNLAAGYRAAGNLDRALPLFQEVADLWKRNAGARSPRYAGALAQIGLTLLQEKKWAEAEAVVREALAIREAKEPDAWTTFNTKSLLGGALLGQKKYAAAEPLMRGGFEGMKQRADKITALNKDRLDQALDRLIELAEATGKVEDAKIWRHEKAKLAGNSTPSPDAKKK